MNVNRMLFVVICAIVLFSKANWCDGQTIGPQEVKVITKPRVAFVRCDYGNEHFEGGRVVIDIFDTHTVVSIAENRQCRVFSFSYKKTFEQIATEALAVCSEFAGKPLAELDPDEPVVLVTVGMHRASDTRAAEIRMTDLLKGNSKQFIDRLQKVEKDARSALGKEEPKRKEVVQLTAMIEALEEEIHNLRQQQYRERAEQEQEQKKNKVPRAKNETDPVKTESKSPE